MACLVLARIVRIHRRWIHSHRYRRSRRIFRIERQRYVELVEAHDVVGEAKMADPELQPGMIAVHLVSPGRRGDVAGRLRFGRRLLVRRRSCLRAAEQESRAGSGKDCHPMPMPLPKCSSITPASSMLTGPVDPGTQCSSTLDRIVPLSYRGPLSSASLPPLPLLRQKRAASISSSDIESSRAVITPVCPSAGSKLTNWKTKISANLRASA